MKIGTNIQEKMKMLAALIAFFSPTSSCKPPASDLASLEKLAFGRDLRSNECSAEPSKRNANLRLDLDTQVDYGSFDKTVMREEIAKVASALPSGISDFFSMSGGKIR